MSKKYRAKGGGLLKNASSSLDRLTRLAMEKLNLNVDYTGQQSAGMAPPPAVNENQHQNNKKNLKGQKKN